MSPERILCLRVRDKLVLACPGAFSGNVGFEDGEGGGGGETTFGGGAGAFSLPGLRGSN